MTAAEARPSCSSMGVLIVPLSVDRRFLLGSLAAAPAVAQPRTTKGGCRPVTIWATGMDVLDYPVVDQTIRQALRVTHDARALRVRISNSFGTEPLSLVSAYVGVRAEGPWLQPGSNHRLQFAGRPTMALPAGARAVSDPVPLAVEAGCDLLVSIAINGAPKVVTGHLRPKDNAWISAAGDHGGEDGAAFSTLAPHWFFADAVFAEQTPNAGAVAVIGDSISDSGSNPRGHYQGWVDILAARLVQLPADRRPALVNLGISGNRVAAERPGTGMSALARLDRDVLAQAGVHTLVIFEGINDIYGTAVNADTLIQAHAQLACRARMAGLRIIGATLLPTRREGFCPDRESVRRALNAFIRTSNLYDAVIDFEPVLADPADPLALAAAFDSGDRLHPSPAGYQAMAAAVPLRLLTP